MIENWKASLTWKLRRPGGETWVSYSCVMPALTAARIASILLREFAGRVMPPYDLDVTGEVKRFSYRTDGMVLLLRRINPASGEEAR